MAHSWERMDAPGMFTTIRVCRGEAWFWEEHLERLTDGACRFRLEAPEPARLLDEVRRAAADRPDARVRVTLPAEGGRTVEAAAYAPPRKPWRLVPVVASPEEDTVRWKTTVREVYDRARQEAGDADDALLVSPAGEVLECTIANVFFVTREGALATPPPERPLLAGIARKRVLRAAARLGIEAVEGPVTKDTARTASGCFVTNALLVVHAVSAIEGVVTYPGEHALARRLRDGAGPSHSQSV